MKKLFNLLIIVLSLFVLTSCKPEEIDKQPDDKGNTKMSGILNIYTLNDFHGAIFESGNEIGISKIGNFLIDEKTNKPDNTIILSAGDMFQGTALSSLTRGKVVVDLMNYIGFDAMALGNHEFDWGIDNIVRYVDGNEENGESKFPFLGANIFHKPTNSYVDWAKPYTVIERDGIKIGVIGLIGEYQTSSILGSISKDFQFTSQIDAIRKYVPILRGKEECDVVIVVSHDDTEAINSQISKLTDEYYVDAVVNGHTHRYYAFEQNRGSNPPLVVVQSGNNGMWVGHIQIEIKDNKVVDASAGFVDKKLMSKPNAGIENLLKNYQTEIDKENESLGISGQNVSRETGAYWGANVIKQFENSDIGVINLGGIRTVGFPINQGDNITFGKVFKIMPFENEVVTLKLLGSDIKRLNTLQSDLRFSTNLNTTFWTIDGQPLKDNEYYQISVVDYVYFKSENFFQNGKDIIIHEKVFRDLLVEDVKESVKNNGKWIIK